jgi:heme-degrading monooxygenase HmoA
MYTCLTIVRYRKRYIPLALLAMALHRIPLWLNKSVTFWKLMGCGKNGSFDIQPDWQQWATLTVHASIHDELSATYGRFITKWWQLLDCEIYTVWLAATDCHGLWNKQQPFTTDNDLKHYKGPIAVLTRATIRINKLSQFWRNVPAVSETIAKANGFITSFGIGEMPFVKQATFSVWQSKEAMQAFAYGQHTHATVIKKTKKEKWYSEELFARFVILKTSGSLHGKDILATMVYGKES